MCNLNKKAVFLGLGLFLTSTCFAMEGSRETNQPIAYQVDEIPDPIMLLNNYPVKECESQIFENQLSRGDLGQNCVVVYLKLDANDCKLVFNLAREFTRRTQALPLIIYIQQNSSVIKILKNNDVISEPEWIDVNLNELQWINESEISPVALIVLRRIQEEVVAANVGITAVDERLTLEKYLKSLYQDCVEESKRRLQRTRNPI